MYSFNLKDHMPTPSRNRLKNLIKTDQIQRILINGTPLLDYDKFKNLKPTMNSTLNDGLTLY